MPNRECCDDHECLHGALLYMSIPSLWLLGVWELSLTGWGGKEHSYSILQPQRAVAEDSSPAVERQLFLNQPTHVKLLYEHNA